MARVSSNSSSKRRKQLNTEYVVLPDVLSVIKIDVYIKFAKQLSEEGLALVNAKDLPRAYVQNMKFVEFVVNKLRYHKSYDLKPYENDKKNLMLAVNIAISHLEVIAMKMDDIEDERIARNKVIEDERSARSEALLLIDAFDGDDTDVEIQHEVEVDEEVLEAYEVITETAVEYADDSPSAPPAYYAAHSFLCAEPQHPVTELHSMGIGSGKEHSIPQGSRIEFKTDNDLEEYSFPDSVEEHFAPNDEGEHSCLPAFKEEISPQDDREERSALFLPSSAVYAVDLKAKSGMESFFSPDSKIGNSPPPYSSVPYPHLPYPPLAIQTPSIVQQRQPPGYHAASDSKIDFEEKIQSKIRIEDRAISSREEKSRLAGEMEGDDHDPFSIFTKGYSPPGSKPNMKEEKINAPIIEDKIGDYRGGGALDKKSSTLEFKDCVRLLSFSEKERQEARYLENMKNTMNNVKNHSANSSNSAARTDSTNGVSGTGSTNKWYQPVPELLQLSQGAPQGGPQGGPGAHPRKPIDRLAGVSDVDIHIVNRIPDFRRFFIPRPTTTQIDFKIGLKPLRFLRDDFQVLYSPFLRTLDSRLQMERAALETNRCFFLHLGIAMQVHPFCLQVAFRHMVALRLADTPTDDMSYELLDSVRVFAGFVDANCLLYLWPPEFDSCRVCIVSGSVNRPIFSCFFSQEGIRTYGSQNNLRDVIIYCNGSHFTLLRPVDASAVSSFSVLNNLLSAARGAGLIVQENVIENVTGRDGAGRDGGVRATVVSTLQGIIEAGRNKGIGV